MLINNASIFEKDDIKSISSELWDKHIDVNLKAPLFLSKEFANQLSKRNQGIIINFLDQSVLTYRPNFIFIFCLKKFIMVSYKIISSSIKSKY